MEKERASFDSLLYNKTPLQQIQDPICRDTLLGEVDVGFSGSPVWVSQSYGLGMRDAEALGSVLGISHYQTRRYIPSAFMAGGCLYPFKGPSVMSSFESVPFSGKSDEDVEKIIIDALENKNYDWRTIDGIVRETALSKEEVCNMIKKLAKDGIVVRAPYTAKNGANIYTTRKHYHETIGPLGRLISALTNRII